MRLTAVDQRIDGSMQTMCQLARRSRRAGWLIERALWRRPGHARGTARAARHSPRLAVQRQSRLANTAHSTSMLPTRQQSAAPACSGRCGAAAPPPRPVYDVTYSDPPSRFSFFVPNQRDLGGASAPLGGASCAPGAARRRGPLADGPSRGARPVGVALTRRARPPASFSSGPRTVRRKSRQSPVHPEFCRFS